MALAVNAVSYVLAVSSTRSVPNSVVLAITDLAVSGLCLYAAVAVVNKAARFQQAFTAFAGGTAVVNLVAVPFLWLNSASPSPTIGLLDIVFIIWGLSIIAHVLRHTLEVGTLMSVGLAFGFYVVVLNLMAITGVIGPPETGEKSDSQTSIYQYVTDDWLSRA